ncbi:MAG TPA: hypothetical protein VNG13_09805 [Mycobacteriales bacterium]|nr:hypothetical protein [Mycobacteriales bacterium]
MGLTETGAGVRRSTRRSPRPAAGGPRLTRDALTVWIASRASVAVLAVAGAWTVGDVSAGRMPSFSALWNRWDVGLFDKIARWGYFGYPRHYPDQGVAAFFPGEPLLLRAVHVVIPSWILAGLAISAVAGAVAAVALARIAAIEGGPEQGRRSVLYLVASPFAVFLFAGYSESLFLAFALPAWLAGRHARWRSAGLLAAGASLVRITGVFLALALAIEYLATRRSRPRPVDAGAGWLLAPWLAVGGYFGYLRARTGDWLAWQHAQALGWGRSFTSPWQSFLTTWHAAWNPNQGAAYAWSFRTELLAVALGVVLSLVLLYRRRWGEAGYVGAQVAAFATSSFYLSVGRATLLWWPLWVMLAGAALRRPAVHVTYLALAAPLGAVLVIAFTQGHWVG